MDPCSAAHETYVTQMCYKVLRVATRQRELVPAERTFKLSLLQLMPYTASLSPV